MANDSPGNGDGRDGGVDSQDSKDAVSEDVLRDIILSDTAIRPLDNSKAVLADIDHEQLSKRERSRLNTITLKINELRDIREENIRVRYDDAE